MCGHSAVQPLERGEWSDRGGRLEDGTTLSRGETEADWEGGGGQHTDLIHIHTVIKIITSTLNISPSTLHPQHFMLNTLYSTLYT